MKAIFFLSFLTCIFALSACQKANDSVTPDYQVSVHGNWLGTLDGNIIAFTFVEGEFEKDRTLTGSASLSTGIAYSIGNGTYSHVDQVWFSLYKIPVISKEEYDMKGVIGAGTINGTFTKFNQDGNSIATGYWYVQRIPESIF